MTDVNTSYPDLSSGEISPRLYGRFDLQAFYKGARRIENFKIDVTGMASFRNGTIFSNATRGNLPAFLFTFKITNSVSFVLEFTNLAVRFYRNGGRVHYTGQNITGITKANPAVVTYSGADTYANGDRVWIDGVVGMTEVNGREFTVANVNTGANTFELSGVNSTAYTTYTSGGTVEEIVELATPYTTADLFQLKFAQSGKNLYIAHPSYQPRKLTYTSATSWAITAHAPIQETFAPTQTISGITQANPAVLTYNGSDTYSNGDIVYLSGINGMTELNDERYTVANVNTGTNTFELSGVNSTGYTAYSSGGLVKEIISSAASFLTSNEYPSAVGVYEERLVYGGSNNKPNTLYFARSGEEDDFTLGQEADDGMEYTISGAAGKISWMQGTPSFLAVGCAGDVFRVTGGVDDVITPTSISIRPTNAFGVADIMPSGRGTQVYFSQSNGLTIRSFEYDLQTDGYKPIDMNTIADHITKSGVTQLEYEESRPNVLWATRADGVLAGMTVESNESVSGWQRFITSGEIISIASQPRSASYDQFWVCVKRTINGTDKYYMEYFADTAEFSLRTDFYTDSKTTDDTNYRNVHFEEQKQYIHVDSSLSYYGDDYATTTVTPSAVSGSAITMTAGASVFTADMVDREIWRKSITGAETGRAKITAYTSGTLVTCEVLETFNSTSAIPAGEWYLTTDSVSGLGHLEARECVVIVDGGQHPAETVASGAITLDRQASVVHVGLGYDGYIETNELEGGGTTGTAQTKQKALSACGIRFLNTLYAKYGTDYYKLNQIEMRTAAMAMDRPPLMFSGDVKLTYANETNDSQDGGWARSKRVIVAQDQPFPCNVQLIIPYFTVSN
jgi:hypothetical protein